MSMVFLKPGCSVSPPFSYSLVGCGSESVALRLFLAAGLQGMELRAQVLDLNTKWLLLAGQCVWVRGSGVSDDITGWGRTLVDAIDTVPNVRFAESRQLN